MQNRALEKIGYLAFVMALLFLAYVAGSVTTLMDAFPSKYVRNAYRAADALAARGSYLKDPFKSNLWVRARTPKQGVTVHDAERASAGLTLYTAGHGASAILVDMDGRTVHEWQRPFHDIWDESSVVRKPVPEHQVYFRKATAFPDGELLAIYIGAEDTPWGYGMVRLDRDSNVIWKNLEHQFHHDFSVTRDGSIYALTHEFRKRPVKYNKHLEPPLLEDFVVVLDPDGRTLKKISLLEALQNSPYGRELWRIDHFTLWDPLHTNNIDVLDEQAAAALGAKVPVAAPGQVLVAFRELDGGTNALLDIEKEEIVWAQAGSWKSHHDPDILPNGNILLFDNLGDFGPGGASRVVEVDPATSGIVWSYGGDPDNRLWSGWRSAQEPLPNGNILITESNGARIIEIDRGGRIVWEYINPVRSGPDNAQTSIVSWASRLYPDALSPEFRAHLEQTEVRQANSEP